MGALFSICILTELCYTKLTAIICNKLSKQVRAFKKEKEHQSLKSLIWYDTHDTTERVCCMPYFICSQPTTPKLDALPTYKITDYPLEPRDYKPFAQAKICMTPQDLLIQMWAFEMVPRPESRLRAVVTTKNSEYLLVLTAKPDGSCDCMMRGPLGDKPLDCVVHPYMGEDLQGIYWGVTVTLRRSTVEQYLGPDTTSVGSVLRCNFYKLSSNAQKPHKGSMYPADFAGKKEYALPSLAEFTVVNY